MRREIGQVGPLAGLAQVGERVVDGVARHALAGAPAAGLVGAEAQPADLLGVAGGAVQVAIDELAAGGDAREPVGIGLVGAGVVVRRQRAELVGGADDD